MRTLDDFDPSLVRDLAGAILNPADEADCLLQKIYRHFYHIYFHHTGPATPPPSSLFDPYVKLVGDRSEAKKRAELAAYLAYACVKGRTLEGIASLDNAYQHWGKTELTHEDGGTIPSLTITATHPHQQVKTNPVTLETTTPAKSQAFAQPPLSPNGPLPTQGPATTNLTPTAPPPSGAGIHLSERLSQSLQAMLVVSALITCIELVLALIVGESVSAALKGGPYNPSIIQYNLSILQNVESMRNLLFVAISIPFLVWIYRSYRNPRFWGVQGLSYPPGWAIVTFFIPVLFLYSPYQVVSETWRASDPSIDAFSRPIEWRKAKGLSLTACWWLTYLAVAMLSRLINLQPAPSSNDIWPSVSSFLMLLVLYVIHAICALVLVRRISLRQKQKYAIVFGVDTSMSRSRTPLASYLEELERLSDLHNKGVITEEEFSSKKRQILGL